MSWKLPGARAYDNHPVLCLSVVLSLFFCVVVVVVVVVVVAVVGELGVSSVCRGGGAGVFLLHVCLTCMFTCMPFTCMFTGCCA